MKLAILAIALSTSAAFTGCVAADQPTISSNDQALTSQEVEKYYFSDATRTRSSASRTTTVHRQLVLD
jgi:hypothetical protein